jgi:hypothetical protein
MALRRVAGQDGEEEALQESRGRLFRLGRSFRPIWLRSI